MEEEIIKSVACDIWVKGNRDLKAQINIYNTKTETGTSRRWTLFDNPMNRLRFPSERGVWEVVRGDLLALGVMDWSAPDGSKTKSFINLYPVPEDFLKLMDCASEITGSGDKFSPLPEEKLEFKIWFGCI